MFLPRLGPSHLQVDNLLHAFLVKHEGVREQLVEAMQGLAVNGEISVGSICSGWGTGDMVIDCLNLSLGRLCGPNVPKAGLSGMEGRIWVAQTPSSQAPPSWVGRATR